MNPDSANSSPDFISTQSLPQTDPPLTLEDLLAEDAPIEALLDVRRNPNLARATPEQLQAFCLRLRTLAASSPTLTAKIKNESDKVRKPRALSPEKQKLRQLMEDL